VALNCLEDMCVIHEYQFFIIISLILKIRFLNNFQSLVLYPDLFLSILQVISTTTINLDLISILKNFRNLRYTIKVLLNKLLLLHRLTEVDGTVSTFAYNLYQFKSCRFIIYFMTWRWLDLILNVIFALTASFVRDWIRMIL